MVQLKVQATRAIAGAYSKECCHWCVLQFAKLSPRAAVLVPCLTLPVLSANAPKIPEQHDSALILKKQGLAQQPDEDLSSDYDIFDTHKTTYRDAAAR